MKSLRKTKIVGTIGPASENRLEELFDAGLNVTRINYSHGSWEEQKDKTETILKLREEKVEQKIWVMWWQGEENAPRLVINNLNRLRSIFGTDNVILITKNIPYCSKLFQILLILHL